LRDYEEIRRVADLILGEAQRHMKDVVRDPQDGSNFLRFTASASAHAALSWVLNEANDGVEGQSVQSFEKLVEQVSEARGDWF
jgi:hypothetical protein